MAAQPFVLTVDTTELKKLAARIEAAGKKSGPVIARALNRTGDQTATKVKRVIGLQMGLPVSAVAKRMTTVCATPNKLEFAIIGTGRPVGLKDFDARQTGKGVSAMPWGKRHIFPRSFFVKSLNGHVFHRVGEKVRMGLEHGRKRDSKYAGQLRQPIKAMYGPGVPKEMVRNESAAAFKETVYTVFPKRIEHEIARIFGT